MFYYHTIDLRMDLHVSPESVFQSKVPLANFALVRFLSRVDQRVIPETVHSSEFARTHIARIVSFARVLPHVNLQETGLDKGLVAYGALVRSEGRMQLLRVHRQFRARKELLCAARAFEVSHSFVSLLMLNEIRVVLERFTTGGTGEGGLCRVGDQVNRQSSRILKLGPTQLAVHGLR